MDRYIVIGAGILGASTAYHLAKNGAHVTIIDRKHPGQATDAAAGIVCPWVSQRRNKAWYQLAKAGAKYYQSLITELESIGQTNTGYKQVGAICIHSDEKKLIGMEERAKKRRNDGAPEIGEISRISSIDTNELFPPLSDHFSSVLISGGARVNGRAIRDALISGAIYHGANLIKGQATLIKNEGVEVKIEGNIISGNKIIVTAGAWAKELLEPFGINFLVRPQKAQIMHLDLQNKDTSNWPVVLPPSNHYLLAFEEGRVVIGATHEDDQGFDTTVTAGGQHEVLDKALSVAPGLKSSVVIETRVGFRPFTPDFLPVLGKFPNYDELFVANGLGASGLTVGPYLGRELAKLASETPTELDLADYDINGAIGEYN